jgi:RHS repeat-associated protein
LNDELTVPIISKAGRGSTFSYNLVYDSAIWQIGSSNGTTSWIPTTTNYWGWTGLWPAGWSYITYSVSYASYPCGYQGQSSFQEWSYGNFTFFDKFGLSHAFPNIGGVYISSPGGGTCPNSGVQPTTQQTQLAPDGSGYTIYATINYPTPSAYMIDNKGNEFSVVVSTSPPTSGNSSTSDRNGNIVSQTNGVYTDTLGTTALSVIGYAPSSTNLSYTAPSGATASYVVAYTGKIVRTAFGCSGITEYNSGTTNINLVTSITLPDSSTYQFTYEQTPGFPSDVTGRIGSIKLPTGGTITYTYSGGSNGINCSDGSTATLGRQTPDGTWSYAQAKGSGSASTTTVTDPQSNQTVIQFQGVYEAQRQTYQGLTSGTLLQTINTCYNASTSPCTGTAITLPITQRTITTIWPGSANLEGQHIYKYNSSGLLTEQDDYDYGSGAPGGLLAKTSIAYASLGNITSFPQSVILTNSGGSTVKETTFSYDQTGVVATSGTPQHSSVSGSRGNVTTTNSYSGASSYLTSSSTYFDTGNVQTTTDVNGAQTTYTYGACGNSFVTSVSEPLSLSKSLAYDSTCKGAVVTSATDENGKSTTVTYSDPYFWRPASITDPTGAATNICYGLLTNSVCAVNSTQLESTLTFNSGNSAVDILTTEDGMGRAQLNQTRQSPSSSNFDTVETDFDTLGRVKRITLPFTGTAGQTSSTAPSTTTTYDALSRVLQRTDASGGYTSDAYSQNDVLVTLGPASTGENTKRQQFEYNALNELTSVCELTSASPSGACGQTSSQSGFLTKYSYDALGDMTAVSQNAQPNGTAQGRTYSFDYLSRLKSETNPESGTTTYTYDSDSTCGTSNNDQVKRVDAVGNTTCYAYDALHRRTGISYPSGSYAGVTPAKTFVYDSATVNATVMQNAKGRIAEAYTGPSSGKITDLGYSYTARGEISDVYESTPHASGYFHVNETYWPHGAPLQTSQLVGLPAIAYGGTIGSTVGLDGEGRITQVTASSGQNPVVGASYLGSSHTTQVNFGSGDSDVFAYDANTLRMNQYTLSVNSQSLTGALTWNLNATLQKQVITDPFNSSDNQTCTYGYDDLTRLTSANCGSAAAQTFTYDPFGNVNKSGSPNSFQPVYSASTNRMTSLPGNFTPSYDSNGNVTNDSNHVYTWDADGNPVTIDGIALTYDALDRAVEKNASGVYTEIAYAPTGRKLALMSGQTLQKAFVQLPGGAVAVYNASGLDHYRHSDWLGSSRLTSTATRSVLGTSAYAPFGESYAQSGTADPSFTGENQDITAGLYDFPAREYSIEGRWPSPDPAGLGATDPGNPQSWNRYAYVLNNPLNLTDSTGLCPDDAPSENCPATPGPFVFFDPKTGTSIVVEEDGTVNAFQSDTAPDSPDGFNPALLAAAACTIWYDPCQGAQDEMANMPNLSAIYNMKEGGNSTGGGFLANDLLGALEASAQSDPGNTNAWGYTLSLKNGVFSGGWSIDAWASDINKVNYNYVPSTGIGYYTLKNSMNPVGPSSNAIFNLGPPAPLPSAMAPSAHSYQCTSLQTSLNQLLASLASNPSLSFDVSVLQKQFVKSCG